MRLNLSLTKNRKTVPFDHQEELANVFKNWLNISALKSKIRFYSPSWLQGSTALNGGLFFPKGAQWFISFPETTLINELIEVIWANPDVIYGMKVKSVNIQATPHFGNCRVFKVTSPVLARQTENDKGGTHFIYSQPEADDILTDALRRKMREAGFADVHNQATVTFVKDYRHAKTKLVKINNQPNRASVCPVVVKGTPEAVRFAWNTGVGQNTNLGFGSLAEKF